VGDDLRRAKPPQTCCGNRMSHASRSQSNQSIRQNRRPSRYRDRLLAQRNALEFPFRANAWPREIEVARVRNDEVDRPGAMWGRSAACRISRACSTPRSRRRACWRQ
jgi:hypothetical protein